MVLEKKMTEAVEFCEIKNHMLKSIIKKVMGNSREIFIS